MPTPTRLDPRRKSRRLVLCLLIGLPLYLLSTGPVAWATNDGLHPAYLPQAVEIIYLPLVPLMKIGGVNQLFYYYTAVLWGGFPAGYTTL